MCSRLTSYPAPPAPPAPAQAWCLFQCGGRHYTTKLIAVVEVLSVDHVIRLPLSPSGVMGLCLKGRDLIPITLLPGVSQFDSNLHSVLVMRYEGNYWGFAVDQGKIRVASIETINCEMLDPTPDPEIPGYEYFHIREGVRYAIIDPENAWKTLRDRIKHWYAQYMGAATPGAGKSLTRGSTAAP